MYSDLYIEINTCWPKSNDFFSVRCHAVVKS